MTKDEFVQALERGKDLLRKQGAFTDDYQILISCSACKCTFSVGMGDEVYQAGRRFYCYSCATKGGTVDAEATVLI